MEIKDDSQLDSANRYRKFGLPNWMVNNIERLNFVTDFEQYACSPPETESFLTEHVESCDFYEASPPSPGKASDFYEASPPSPGKASDFYEASPPSPVNSNEPPEEKPKISPEPRRIPESKSTPNLIMNASEHLATLSIVENLKHEEFSCSSPDSTPCVTPEPSPAPRRKMSGQQDSVQTNPGRWFYLGNFKKAEQNSKGVNVNGNKENRLKYSEKSSDKPYKIRDSPVKPKKSGIKLVISNFDINAISPSSW